MTSKFSGWSVLPKYESCKQYFCVDFEYNIAFLQKVSGKKKVNKGKKLDRVYLRPRPSSTSNPLIGSVRQIAKSAGAASTTYVLAPAAIHHGIALPPIIATLRRRRSLTLAASRRGGCWRGWIRASSAPSSPSPGSFSSSPDSGATYI